MEQTYRPLGTRWKYTKQHSHIKHKPYDYEDEGLLIRLLPERITTTENATTRAVLAFVEDVCVRLLKYVDELRYFKDWNYRRW